MDNIREKTKEWLENQDIEVTDVMLDRIEWEEHRIVLAIENNFDEMDLTRWDMLCKKLGSDIHCSHSMFIIDKLWEDDIEVLDITDDIYEDVRMYMELYRNRKGYNLIENGVLDILRYKVWSENNNDSI